MTTSLYCWLPSVIHWSMLQSLLKGKLPHLIAVLNHSGLLESVKLFSLSQKYQDRILGPYVFIHVAVSLGFKTYALLLRK